MVFPSPLFPRRVPCDSRRTAPLSEWRQKILRSRPETDSRCQSTGASEDSCADLSAGVWKYAPSTITVSGIEQSPAWVIAPRSGRRNPSKRCCTGRLSTIAMDMNDAQRGGVINAVVLLQIVPPARITRCANAGTGRDHAGIRTSSCPGPPSESDMGASPGSGYWGIADM